jgi:hypothetical protein
MIGAKYYGAKFGAVIIGAKVFATQVSRLRRCGQEPWRQMRWLQEV